MTISDKNIQEKWTATNGPASVEATFFYRETDEVSSEHRIQFGGSITVDPSGAITSAVLTAARDALAEVLLGLQAKYGDTPPPP